LLAVIWPWQARARCSEQEYDDAAFHLPWLLVDRAPATPLLRPVIPVNAIARLLLDFVLPYSAQWHRVAKGHDGEFLYGHGGIKRTGRVESMVISAEQG
jgi:hypothetical protein